MRFLSILFVIALLSVGCSGDGEVQRRLEQSRAEVAGRIKQANNSGKTPSVEDRLMQQALDLATPKSLENLTLVSAYIYGPQGNHVLRLSWIGKELSANGASFLDASGNLLVDIEFHPAEIEYNQKNSERYVMYEAGIRVEHSWPTLWAQLQDANDTYAILTKNGQPISNQVTPSWK